MSLKLRIFFYQVFFVTGLVKKCCDLISHMGSSPSLKRNKQLMASLAAKSVQSLNHTLITRGGVEDTRLEAKAKAKDTKKIRGQGQPFRGQTLSRPRTGMLEAKAKDQGHKAQVLSKKKKKKRSSQKFFRRSPKKKKKKKKVFTKIFQAISTKKRFPDNFSSAPQNFNIPKNSAVLEPRTGQFSRT